MRKNLTLAKKAAVQPSGDDRAFIERRITPFLRDQPEHYPLGHLLMEAYMQGMRDTLQAQIAKEDGHG